MTSSSFKEKWDKLSPSEKKDLTLYLDELISVVEHAPVTSKTHYHELDAFTDPVYAKEHAILDAIGFKNGDPDANKIKPLVNIWWKCIYPISTNVLYTFPFLHHHCSSEERQKVMLRSYNAIKGYINGVECNLIEGDKVRINGSLRTLKRIKDHSPSGTVNTVLSIEVSDNEILAVATIDGVKYFERSDPNAGS